MIMSLRMDSQVLKSLLFCSSVLGLKYLLSIAASIIPNRLAGDIPPEDEPLWDMLLGKDLNKESFLELKERFNRVVRNDAENIPIGLGLLWMAGLASANASPTPEGGPSAEATSVIRLTQIFTISRLVFSGLFYGGITGARTVAYLGGKLD